MTLPQQVRRRLAVSRVPYICPQCQIKQFSTTSSQNKTSGVFCATQPRPAKRIRNSSRCAPRSSFNTSSSLSALEEVTSTSNQTTILPFIRKSDQDSRPTSTALSKAGLIRKQLREWSKNNIEEKARADASTTQNASPAPLMPHALFLEAAPNTTDGQDEIAEELEEELDFDESGDLTSKSGFVPGDLVYTRFRQLRRTFAVYLGTAGVQHQYLLDDGRWVVESSLATYGERVPNFITDEERLELLQHVPNQQQETTNAAGMVYLMSKWGDIAPHVTRPILSRIANIKEDITNFRRQHLTALDSVYDRLAHETNYVTTNMPALSEQLLGTPAEDLVGSAKLALFLAVDKESPRMQICRGKNSKLLTVVITPKQQVKHFQQVITWTRDYQEAAASAIDGSTTKDTLKHNPLSSFIDKARRLILKSRDLRHPTTIGSLGPSKMPPTSTDEVEVVPSGEAFSATDQMIIDFLWDTNVRSPSAAFKSTNHSISSLILRAVGAYPRTKLESHICKLFLQEIGCMPPWAEPEDETVAFPLPGRRGGRMLQDLINESEAASQRLGFKADSGSIPLTDTMADLRHDFGSMEVFSIDSESTKVIDDGISLEECNQTPGRYWLHVHIAHPSAFIPRDHIFAKQAAAQCVSLYTTKQLYPMMPYDVCTSFSLRENAPTLTISTLLDDQGKVHDVKMRPSKVQNVIRLVPKDVFHVLGGKETEAAEIVIGSNQQYLRGAPNGSENGKTSQANLYTDVLHKIAFLTQARLRARETEVAPFPKLVDALPERDVQVSFIEPYTVERLQQSYHYRGDPTIRVSSARQGSNLSPELDEAKQNLTAAVMQVANESAGKWFADRNIPVVFTGSVTQSSFTIAKLSKMQNDTFFFLPRLTLTSHPQPHVVINVKQYSRATSPLRRYPDLISGWQFDAFYRTHVNGNSAAHATSDHVDLPFSAAEIDHFCSHKHEAITVAERSQKESAKHWVFQAFFRALHFKEQENISLPKVWDLVVTMHVPTKVTDDDSRIRGRLHPFNLRCVVLQSDQRWEERVRRDNCLPVTIELVDPVNYVVYVRPVGPPSTTFTQTDPINIKPNHQVEL